MEHLDNLIMLHPSWNATEIHRQLEKDIDQEVNPELKGLSSIGLRTTQSYVRASRPLDTSGEWVPTDCSGEDAGLLLQSLAEAHYLSEEIHWPTKREAERILWVRRAAPTLPPLIAWALTRFILMREDRGESTRPLEMFLGYRCWASDQLWDMYLQHFGESLEGGIHYCMSLIEEFRQHLDGISQSEQQEKEFDQEAVDYENSAAGFHQPEE